MASLSGHNKIVLKAGYTEGGAEYEEGPLTGAATPGMNMVLSVAARTQERDSWTPGSTDYPGTGTGATTTKNPVRILKEDHLIGATIDDVVAAGNNGFIHIAKPGDVLLVLVASGQTVVRGDGLSAISTGKWNNDATNVAVEALESSGGALAADTHMRVRVL
jgi:hypothetical protein